MGGDYRDDLAAAHARIAELEEKIGALETELSRRKSTPPDPEIRELEAAVAIRRSAADPNRTAGLQRFLLLSSVMFLLAVIVFLRQHDLAAAAVSGLVLFALVVGRATIRAKLPPARRALEDAERRLAEARRVRVAPVAEDDLVDAEGAEDQNVVRFRA